MKRIKLMHVILMVLTLAALMAVSGCKKDSKNESSSGGGVSPAPNPQAPFTGDLGQLSGDWTGKNSSGGSISMSISNGMIKTFSYGLGNQVGSNGTVSAQSYEPRILIDPETGQFYGLLEPLILSGTFVSNDSVTGEILDLNAPDSTITFTGSVSRSRPDETLFGLDIYKDVFKGVINLSGGSRLCEEDEYLCNSQHSSGSSVSLEAVSLSPLYVFDKWERDGDCTQISGNRCDVNMDSHKLVYARFEEILLDGRYSGSTEQGENVEITVTNNRVRVATKVKMGINQCSFSVDETADDPVIYANLDFISGLLFGINYNQNPSITGAFETPSSGEGYIQFNSKGLTSDPNCQEQNIITFTFGGEVGLASVGEFSRANPETNAQAIKNALDKYKATK